MVFEALPGFILEYSFSIWACKRELYHCPLWLSTGWYTIIHKMKFSKKIRAKRPHSGSLGHKGLTAVDVELQSTWTRYRTSKKKAKKWIVSHLTVWDDCASHSTSSTHHLWINKQWKVIGRLYFELILPVPRFAFCSDWQCVGHSAVMSPCESTRKVLLGLDRAGKTTILYKLAARENHRALQISYLKFFVTLAPTVGLVIYNTGCQPLCFWASHFWLELSRGGVWWATLSTYIMAILIFMV
jgi:hypothetical protein